MRLAVAVAVAAVLIVTAPAASAQVTPLTVVHSERVPFGDGTLTASFTDWPIRAGRSLDFTFEPSGGIEGRTGTVRAIAPSGQPRALGIVGLDGEPDMKLRRHPQARHAWGLDVVALPEEGRWRFEFTVHGPSGVTTATLPITAGPAPGPPMALSWTVGMIPWAAALLVLARRWTRARKQAVLAWSD
ncbi:hypothetical protein [Kibdelosporangium phytohabitans]|uniref:YtkA-like domain-containing protein n=1 Tax=Kibdelosporangium phytohabitans TaxID=860235 RepID=A0A0N9HZY7_9PSEU|nr:hypothetical protein [Kibdelosporangium phytohabitans]ALG10878.1 hypothetical protein AOZ06_31905 [Kibdelosporangium phytohabitans]MBE1462063.1 hypothetical protein [Kibdelosporangium phytohabitans]